MSGNRKVALVLVGLFGVIAVVAWSFRGSDLASGERVATGETGDELERIGSTRADSSAPTVDVQDLHAASPATRDAVPQTPALERDDGLAEVRGKIVSASGTPIGGANVEIRGWPGDSQRVLQFGVPTNWVDPVGATASDGTFALRFDPPQAFQFVLDVEAMGHPKISWRWGSLRRSGVTDVGVIELPACGSIEGAIVDSAGKPAPGKWQVDAESDDYPTAGGGDTTRVSVSALDGRFRLDGIPVGLVDLRAQSKMTNRIPGPSVEVKAGEVTRANIVYSGPDLSRRILLTITHQRLHGYPRPDPTHVRLLSSARDPMVLTRVAGSSPSWAVDDLPPGEYTIEITDPRFQPWTRPGVAPGTAVSATLVGASSIALEVVDARTSEPVIPTSVRVRFRNVSFQPDEFELCGAAAPAPENGVYTGIVPGDLTVIVMANGYATTEVALDAIVAGETRPCRIELGHGVSVRGIVRENGVPVKGVPLQLLPAAQKSGRPVDLDDAVEGSRQAETDAAGRFEFTAVATGKYVLKAERNEWLRAETAPFAAGPADDVERILDFPPSGFLEGRITGAHPAHLASFKVNVRIEDPVAFHPGLSSGIFATMMGSLTKDSNVDENGAFRIGPVPAGEVSVQVDLPPIVIFQDANGESMSQGQSYPLGSVVIPAGGVVSKFFDLGDAAPGTLEVSVTIDGERAEGFIVRAHEVTGSAKGSARTTDGVAKLSPLPQGTVYIVVLAPDRSFVCRSSGFVTIPRGGTVRESITIELVPGIVNCIDEAGNPLINTDLALHMHGIGKWVHSNADGRIELKLPRGDYRLSRRNKSMLSGAVLPWPPPDRLVIAK